MIGPIFVQLSDRPEYQNIVFLKVDVDDNQVCWLVVQSDLEAGSFCMGYGQRRSQALQLLACEHHWCLKDRIPCPRHVQIVLGVNSAAGLHVLGQPTRPVAWPHCPLTAFLRAFASTCISCVTSYPAVTVPWSLLLLTGCVPGLRHHSHAHIPRLQGWKEGG
jgi:hypothetical protein